MHRVGTVRFCLLWCDWVSGLRTRRAENLQTYHLILARNVRFNSLIPERNWFALPPGLTQFFECWFDFISPRVKENQFPSGTSCMPCCNLFPRFMPGSLLYCENKGTIPKMYVVWSFSPCVTPVILHEHLKVKMAQLLVLQVWWKCITKWLES